MAKRKNNDRVRPDHRRKLSRKAFGQGLCELRLKGAEGIARVSFCTLVEKRIVMLHSFVKKSEKTPLWDREIAEMRMKEVKRADT
ncbi:MAG TPA: type II toxin-antitoxin system RelE/ParE family toxin [Nitrospira sp.]|nr:type II toxin-antitoxin system RelE/ParE family toxin [Nitrospira sp.]